jgi:hypothetical protein
VRRFQQGEAIALRELWHDRIWAARPLTVVADRHDLLMFFLPIGTEWQAPGPEDAEWIEAKFSGVWTLSPRRWTTMHVLSFAWPDAGHAVLHFWDENWTPRSWYVNVQRPLDRFELGFDTLDQDLDIVVSEDRSSWTWKDEEDVARGVALGAYSEAEAAGFRDQAEHGLRRLVEQQSPFDRDWTSWRPDPAWPEPALPQGWDWL